MFKFKSQDQKYAFYALLTTFVALLLRCYKLDFQSLWLDELHTMKECDPKISWAETLRMVWAFEIKSPVYFFMDKAVMIVFGYTAVAARLLSAFAGAASVSAMFLLGKELYNARTGFIAALLTSVNYFNLYYSQEARGYILLFLCSVFMLLYFIRMYKKPAVITAILYGLFALLALHFHPFAILLIMAQCLIILVYFIAGSSKGKKIAFLKYFSISFLIVLAGLLPLVTNLTQTAEITSMWIPMPTPDYFVHYFSEFFGSPYFMQVLGGSWKLKVVLTMLLFSFLIHTGIELRQKGMSDPMLVFKVSLIFVSLIVAFAVPYLYSIYRVPALVIRYMIVILPVILLVVTLGISELRNAMLRNAVLVVFLAISILPLWGDSGYYTTITKSEFRGVTQYVKDNSPEPYPVINESTGWMFSYYFETLSVPSKIIKLDKNALADSVKAGRRPYTAFWLIGAHADQKPDKAHEESLKQTYDLVRDKDFNYAWAQLYVVKNSLAPTVGL